MQSRAALILAVCVFGISQARASAVPSSVLAQSATQVASLCANITRFEPTSPKLLDVSRFIANITTCSPESAGPNSDAPGECLWNPRTFLLSLYYRAEELMLHGVDFESAFMTMEHARFAIWQFQTCWRKSSSEYVSIPVVLESLYGFIIGKTRAKYTTVSPKPEFVLSPALDYAIMDLATPFSPLTIPQQELTTNLTTVILKNRARHQTPIVNGPMHRLGMSPARSNPTLVTSSRDRVSISQSDCDANAPEGIWRLWISPSVVVDDELEHCCASACEDILSSVNVAPSDAFIGHCCAACNKFNCDPIDSTTRAAIALHMVIEVPDLLNGYSTTITIDV